MGLVITINDLQEGMILAEPVVNNFGQTLLNSGVTVSAQHKRILKTWNIHSVIVKSDDQAESNELSEKIIALATEALKARLEWTPRNPIELDLFNTAVKLYAENNKGSL